MFNWITYLCISILVGLILYLTLGRAWLQLRRNEKNRRECMGNIWATFFDPVTGGSENFLCPVYDTYKVIPPLNKSFETSLKGDSDKAPHGFYLLVNVKNPDGNPGDSNREPEPVGSRGRVAMRDIWPPNRPVREQVIVDHAYFVKGHPSALDPYNDFIPTNTDRIVEAMVESRTAEALSLHMRHEIDALQRIGSDIATAAKSAKLSAIATLVIGAILIIALIGLAVGLILPMSDAIGKISTALGVK